MLLNHWHIFLIKFRELFVYCVLRLKKMKSYKGYLIEGFVIAFSVLLSLYLGNLNESLSDKDKKEAI